MGEIYIPNHAHDKGQFIYTEGGIVYIQTESKLHFLPAWHYMWIPPGINHAIYPSSKKVVMRNLYFPVKKEDKAFYQKEGVYPVTEMLLQMLLFTRQWKGDISHSDGDRFPIFEAFKVLLPQVSDSPLSLTLPYPKDPRLEKVVNYLRDHLDESILLSDLGNQFGLSERSLLRLFKSNLNMSFMQYYTLMRIFRAVELLIERRYTVSEIAVKVGYSSIPSFSNTFYKVMGKRPSEYIQKDDILQ